MLIATVSFAQKNDQPYYGNSLKLGESTKLNFDYKGIIEFGYLSEVGNYGMDRIKLNIINGCRIGQYFSLGVGTGLRYYLEPDAYLIPFFGNFRGNFDIGNILSYLSLDLGYSFNATHAFESTGFLLSPTFGVGFRGLDKSIITVGIGYEMQNIPTYYSGYFESYRNFGAISFNVGFSF